MARTPRKQHPKHSSSGEHIIFHGPGPYVMPDLLSCEGVERGKSTNIVLIRALTHEDRRLAIPLLSQAVASLVAASPIVVRFETLTPGRQIGVPEKGKTLEVPVLERFVCFRAITADWRMAEFLTHKNQRVLVPFSAHAYEEVVDYLKALAPTP
jgi:hypothetical protein